MMDMDRDEHEVIIRKKTRRSYRCVEDLQAMQAMAAAIAAGAKRDIVYYKQAIKADPAHASYYRDMVERCEECIEDCVNEIEVLLYEISKWNKERGN